MSEDQKILVRRAIKLLGKHNPGEPQEIPPILIRELGEESAGVVLGLSLFDVMSTISVREMLDAME